MFEGKQKKQPTGETQKQSSYKEMYSDSEDGFEIDSEEAMDGESLEEDQDQSLEHEEFKNIFSKTLFIFIQDLFIIFIIYNYFQKSMKILLNNQMNFLFLTNILNN